MKKRFLGILAACFLGAASLSDTVLTEAALMQQEQTIRTAEDAETILNAIFSEDKEILDGILLTDDMKKALFLYGGMPGLASVLKKQLGTPSLVETPMVMESGSYTVYLFPCTFAMGRLGLQVTVDANGALAGLVTTEAPVEETTASDSSYRTMELSIPILDGTLEDAKLPGTLTLPDGEGPFPTVLLVHGSGPSDRTETIGQISVFTDLAQGLAQKGIAVFSYDKRTYTYGKQLAADETLTIREETITDAVQALQMLSAIEAVDADHIFVLGHSLGGYTLPFIDRELQTLDTKEAGLIFFAAPARSLPDLLREQIIFLSSLTELSEDDRESLEQTLKQVDLAADPENLDPDQYILGGYADYWKSLADLDPLTAAKELEVPCLVLQGEEDYQVTMEDFELWKSSVGDKESWTFESFQGLTHAFTDGQREMGAAVYEERLHVSQDVIDAIADFVLANDSSRESETSIQAQD